MFGVPTHNSLPLRRASFVGLLALFALIAASSAIGENRVDTVMGKTPQARSYKARYDAAAALPADIPGAQADALLDWLADPEDALPPQSAAAIKNEVANRLMHSSIAPEDLAAPLMVAGQDPRQSEVWRDYCIQHLGALYARTEGDVAEKVGKTLRSALDNREGAIAGTALLALAANRGQAIADEDLSKRAFEIAADSSRGPGSRATALQVLATLDDERAASAARNALGSSRSVILRISALSALGDCGTADDRQVIASYSNNPLQPLRKAAERALNRIESRID